METNCSLPRAVLFSRVLPAPNPPSSTLPTLGTMPFGPYPQRRWLWNINFSFASKTLSPANIARLFHGLWVARRRDGAHFDAFPQINLYPAIIVERRDGQLISVVDQLRGRIAVPHRYDDLSAHIGEVERNAAAVCTENFIRVDDVMESPKLAE
jgi:hypothetical protein